MPPAQKVGSRPQHHPKQSSKPKRRRGEASRKPSRVGAQLTLDDARKPDGRHGGWRPGAGRKKRHDGVAHDVRAEFPARHPVLVTWRLIDGLPSLRHARYADIVVAGIAAVHTTTFRVTDYSIQSNHVHLICEAAGRAGLESGLLSLAGRIASRINRAMGHNGELFADRYHDRVLETPREVKNALRYVINNARHHGEAVHYYFHPDWIDPFSSAPWFDGWQRPVSSQQMALAVRRVTAEPRTWLRRVGWRQWGLLGFDEVPGGSPR
jgi:REP element-mobilizing transposase RayT